ncbi:hypothetical protein G7Y79_00044g080410 [Physcia stellaris]|nr:hypothetical protein G7Y79_00044g080410 [Physcia stellaris]
MSVGVAQNAQDATIVLHPWIQSRSNYGNDNTFGGFPEHLRALVSNALPKVSVVAVTYPTFETRGDLHECVGRFREWLQNQVIDLEVSASTPSPTIDPSVRVILIGHSMGGIVGAETVLSIISDPPIPPASSRNSTESIRSKKGYATPLNRSRKTSPASSVILDDPASSNSSFMFPYIQGLLAFDTPYLGISPSVVAHGAENHYKSASLGRCLRPSILKGASTGSKALTAGPESAKDALAGSVTGDAAATPAWQRWGKYAMFAGAAGAVAAGGAAAYIKRDAITEGWTWVGSHLEFVGCLVRGEELKSRFEKIVKLKKEKGIGFSDLVTVLGKGAVGGSTAQPKTVAGGWVEVGGAPSDSESKKRTFCNIPKAAKDRKSFEEAVNNKATDETKAHMTMFLPRENPGYYNLSLRAKKLIVEWVDQAWYESSEIPKDKLQDVEMEGSLGGEDPIVLD